MDSTNQKRLPADARDVFDAWLPWQVMVKLYKGRIFFITETQFAIQSQVTKQPNSTERLHVDATIMRSFQEELISSFLLSSYAGHVNLAAAKHWWFMPKWKDGSTVGFIIFRVQHFLSANTVDDILWCFQPNHFTN